MQALWPGSFVEEANITVLISSLRKVLGERDADDPYIQTVPKKGYRFTAPGESRYRCSDARRNIHRGFSRGGFRAGFP